MKIKKTYLKFKFFFVTVYKIKASYLPLVTKCSKNL